MKLTDRKKRLIYLDVCALGRPYDDQSFPQIEVETVAISVIISRVKAGAYVFCHSPVHDTEIRRNPDEQERTETGKLLTLYGQSTVPLLYRVYDSIERKAITLESLGIKAFDALHVAHAEALGAAFITCDKALLKKCHQCQIEIWFGNPIDFCKKEGLL